jgi:hypothetical protein
MAKDDKHQESQKEQYRKLIKEIIDKTPPTSAIATYNQTVEFKKQNANARKSMNNARATIASLQSAYTQLYQYFVGENNAITK